MAWRKQRYDRKKEYISDRIRESIDVFGSQPERLGTILMTAVGALAILISKVLQNRKKRNAKQSKDTTKPVMPAEAATYPKLFKIYKELKRQNEIILRAC